MTEYKEKNGIEEKKSGIRNRKYFVENPSALAFLGDALFEVRVRRYVYEKGVIRPDRMNAEAVRYVRAEAQAAALDSLFPQLEDDEASVARRAKNHRITSMPGNIDPITYKKATGFEALLGYLELCGDIERIDFIVARAIEVIETENIVIKRNHRSSE